MSPSRRSHHAALNGSVTDEALDVMLQNPALTASLVGLLGEDALITPRLGGLGASEGVRRRIRQLLRTSCLAPCAAVRCLRVSGRIRTGG